MTTLIQDLEMRQAKISQAIQLLREAGLADFQGSSSVPSMMAGEASKKRHMSEETKKLVGEAMRKRWAEKKAQGKLMNPNQKPRKPKVL